MSTLTFDAPMAPRGFMAKTGALVASTAFAGAALFGGVAVAPAVASSLSASVHHDYVLTADGDFPTFAESLQTLLTALDFGNMGQVLGLFGDDITTSSSLADLLAALNPDGVTLDAVTLGLLSTDFSGLLTEVTLPGPDGAPLPLGSIPIDSLIGGFIGGDGADTSIGDLLGIFGLSDYAGLLNLPFFGLSPDTSLADLLNDMLGITSTMTLTDLLNANDLGDATIAGMLGIDPDDPWNEVISSITLGGTLSDPDGTGVLGDETLGGLLTSLLGYGADPVTDATTLTDFLGDLGIWDMLGLG
ncbi:hypothetical protein MNVM_29460 [Mycobacterium novum]|uniref:Uncharacterized protein n=1 Tax=Mycobacterium novum TaxID=2492438 RepID=A0A7I7JPP7_9MYCO|nr:hypothetical protein [Mycobacterium novum]BBX13865.1 hypothetical protein MNVM_29460 [Mycobacterium novum]